MSGSILIVDDEKSQREILTMILQGVGYDTAEASGVQEALAMLGKREFDLILTDLKMQGQSGLDLLEQVMADDPQQVCDHDDRPWYR
jgi:two component, sigma54 specific, transcriptional regulator, Fis family